MQFRFVFTAGLFVFTTTGCFFHGYSNGYGPGPYVVPQQPGSPGPYYGPGGPYSSPMNGSPTYVPGNSPGVGGPTPIYTPANPPGGSTGTYESPSGSNGNTPGFNPESPAGGKTVPLPGDDPSFDRNTQRPQLTPTSSTSSSVMEAEELPIAQVESRRIPQSSYDSSEPQSDEEVEFQTPSVRQASRLEGSDGEVQFADAPARARAIPFGHHPQFKWVQGTVDFDDVSNTWSIMYDDHPKATDQLGGDLTLADHPKLGGLRAGDVVRFEGAIDDQVEDARGKPVFRMTSFKKL
jgi:hypothetical protein